MKRGKKYLEKIEGLNLVDKHSVEEALKLVRGASYAKFDETLELHVRLGIDPRQSDQQLRGTVVLPSGTGRAKTVAVVAQGDALAAAKDAGADFFGGDDLIERIQGGWFGFDVLITTPDMMAKVSRLGKSLGSKGLMPSPKGGTVTQDVKSAVSEFKAGKVEYRNDKGAIIHLPIGKLSFTDEQLIENLTTVMDVLVKSKPAKTKKGAYLKSVALSSTMGPGVLVDTTKSKWKE